MSSSFEHHVKQLRAPCQAASSTMSSSLARSLFALGMLETSWVSSNAPWFMSVCPPAFLPACLPACLP
eukprot:12882974-Alexandrium_andersonii.AAC.1